MGLKTVVEFTANESPYECGYCNGSATAVSNGMWAHQMTPQDYQDLLERNFRRSGKYCYKPIMDRTCCPLYMIRCDAVEFTLSRGHKKVIKKMNRFLVSGSLDKPTERDGGGGCPGPRNAERLPRSSCRLAVAAESPPSCAAAQCVVERQRRPAALDPDERGQLAATLAESPGADASKAAIRDSKTKPAICRKAKELRLERKIEKLALKGERVDLAQLQKKQRSVAKTLEELMDECSPAEAKHTLDLELLQSHPVTAGFAACLEEEHAVYKRYQMAVHGDTEDKCTRQQFERFLVHSPIMSEPAGTPGVRFGSFHCQYKLDGKIIAVEVLDILPSCVSSKYFFYDPAYEFLNLGTYSALRAIRLTRALQQKLPALRYYLMGYYVHSCPKMRYKAGFKPSYLLCPEAYTWVPLPQCLPKLDINKCSRLEPDIDRVDPEQEGISLAGVQCLCGHHALSYGELQALIPGGLDDEAEVEKYARLVGRTLSGRILLVRA